jgi:hypothetical protein
VGNPSEKNINWNVTKPIKEDYKNWYDYWNDLSDYIIEKYKNTYCRKK